MSKRVYEVARELGLSTKEVIERLNDAGAEVKSNFSIVDDPAYERAFGDHSKSNGSGDATPYGRPEAHGAEALPRGLQLSHKRGHDRSRDYRALAYVVAAILALGVAFGMGAAAALLLRGDTALTGQEGPQPSEQQDDARQAREQNDTPGRRGDADRATQGEADAGQGEAASQQEAAAPRLGETEYVGRVGYVQSNAVEVFMDSHSKLLRYDSITAEDIDEMRNNEAALEEMTREADDLAPPRSFEEQHEVFVSAVAGLQEAARVAYELANDPVAAAETGFDGYDARVDRVAGLLERSNEMLGRDHETIGDPREISPELGAARPARGPEAAAQT